MFDFILSIYMFSLYFCIFFGSLGIIYFVAKEFLGVLVSIIDYCLLFIIAFKEAFREEWDNHVLIERQRRRGEMDSESSDFTVQDFKGKSFEKKQNTLF